MPLLFFIFSILKTSEKWREREEILFWESHRLTIVDMTDKFILPHILHVHSRTLNYYKKQRDKYVLLFVIVFRIFCSSSSVSCTKEIIMFTSEFVSKEVIKRDEKRQNKKNLNPKKILLNLPQNGKYREGKPRLRAEETK